MDISIILIALGLLIFLSHIFGAAFAKTKIPTVLLLMLIGLFIGPITGWVTPESFGKVGSVFTTITLICILFQSGTTLDLHVLGKSIGPALLATILNFVVIVGISVLLGMFMLDLKFIHCCFLGAALGGTSAAVVIPMVACGILVEEVVKSGLVFCDIRCFNLHKDVIYNRIKNSNLLFYRNRLVLILLKNFNDTFALCKTGLCILVEVRTELSEALQLTVL